MDRGLPVSQHLTPGGKALAAPEGATLCRARPTHFRRETRGFAVGRAVPSRVMSAPAARTTAGGRHERLGRRTALVSSLTLVSRVLGFVREVLSAALFGDRSGIYDAFITAWRVPNLFRRFLGEGALSTSFQTALTATDAEHGDEVGAALFARTLRMLLMTNRLPICSHSVCRFTKKTPGCCAACWPDCLST